MKLNQLKLNANKYNPEMIIVLHPKIAPFMVNYSMSISQVLQNNQCINNSSDTDMNMNLSAFDCIILALQYKNFDF